MTKWGGTGLIVEIEGTNEDLKVEGIKTIAFRADIDGLPIPENNQDIDYKT